MAEFRRCGFELVAPTRSLGMLLPHGTQARAVSNFADHLIAIFDRLRDQIRRHEEIVIWDN